MAFCNSCGTTLTPGTRFCSKCGAAILSSAPAGAPAAHAPGTVPAAPTSSGGGGALKIILIVVAVVVGLGILGVAGAGFAAWRIAKHSHVQQEGDHVKVDTPFGSVESSQDPATVAQSIGVDLYPGARALKEGATSATVFGMHTATVVLESSDSVDQISTFYKSKFPNAMVTTSEANHCTIVSSDKKNMITINIEGHDDGTKIQITSVTGKPSSSSSSSSSSPSSN